MKKGFTLLELIIVIIIVGVLAALALPQFFTMIERSRSVEAVRMLHVIRGAVERCYLQTGDYLPCVNDPAKWDTGDPTNAPNAHFYLAGYSAGSNTYSITLIRNNVDLNVPDPGGTIGCPDNWSASGAQSAMVLCVNDGTNRVDIIGSGFYQGMDFH